MALSVVRPKVDPLWQRVADAFAPDYRGGWRCDEDECDGLPHDGWPNKHARTNQLAPSGDWYLWLIQAGRGWGKTRTGAEWLLERMRANPNSLWFLIAETWDDGRDIMVEGESGLIASLRDNETFKWNASTGHFSIANGAQAHLFSGEKPSKVRGPNLMGGWGDEPGKWRYGKDVWQTLEFAIRKGDIRVCLTGTPVNTPFYRLLLSEADIITRGDTEENMANLSDKFKARVIAKYRGTRLGRQELAAELLDDVKGALWTPELIDNHRLPYEPMPQFDRIVIAVDPNVSEGGDACGIAVCGREQTPLGPRAGIIEDASTPEGPRGWAKRVVEAYHDWKADAIVAEVNNGGDLVEINVQVVDKSLRVTKVSASRGKTTRAQPIATATERGIWNFYGFFGELEDELTGWVPPAPSPNRLDAMVWGATDLLGMIVNKKRKRRLRFDG